MIDDLVILNYKSARQVQLTCRKMNIIIGQPNSGKSNILEALGLFTLFNNECKIQELARFQTMHNLFYDNNINNPIHIRTSSHRLKIQMKENFEVDIETKMNTTIKSYELYYDQTGKLLNAHPHYNSPVNLYKFRSENTFANKSGGALKPPFGDNLVQVMLKNLELRKTANDVFKQFGYNLAINPLDSTISIMKESDGIMVSHPYTMASHMLQRYVFHLAAIDTNKDSIIIFEEPESYASTAFTRHIAEKIAGDATNQYFISSHNPQFLVSMLKMMPREDVKIYYAFYENYQTQVKALIEEDLDMILTEDMNVIDRLGEKLAGRI